MAHDRRPADRIPVKNWHAEIATKGPKTTKATVADITA